MHLRKTVSNPDFKNTEPEFNLQNHLKPGSAEENLSLPNLWRITYKTNEQILENFARNAVRNLDYEYLSLYLPIPVIIKSNLIRELMNILLYCRFSDTVIRKGYQYIRKFSSATFEVLLNKVTKRAYPLIVDLISKSLNFMCDVNGFTIIWPLHLLLILAEKDFKLSIKSNLLLPLYEKYISNNLGNDMLEGCPILHKEDYDALKKMTVNLYKTNKTFGQRSFQK